MRRQVRWARMQLAAFVGVVLTLAGMLGVGRWSTPISRAEDADAKRAQTEENFRRQQETYADPNPYPFPPGMETAVLIGQTAEEMQAKSTGCIQCHQNVGDPHCKESLKLGCTDCHGGDANATDKHVAHVQPRYPDMWRSAANPVRSYTLLNHESPEFVRFVNPGDLRVAHISCGTAGCHAKEVLQVRKSMMTHGAMLWGAALYNNGAVPFKWARYGEAYSMNGKPVRLQTVPPPTPMEMERGVLPFLDPLPRFEATQPGNILRIFERGGRFRTEVGIPERLEESGRPRERLSDRGIGTQNRTDPVFIGLQKTRLFDPTLNFMGTNDHAGDYRASGCTACHFIYANDRSPTHSAGFCAFGNRGKTSPNNPDPTINKNESGHPIAHKFTTGVPSSQCMVCHIHPGTTVMNSYFGYMWWDQETDGEMLYPAQQKKLTNEEFNQQLMRDPNEISARGVWADEETNANITDLNPHFKHMQLADFHGHGWLFRAVFKHDQKGQLLDHAGKPAAETTANLVAGAAPPTKDELASGTGKCPQDGVPVHLMDIHLERGMHCVDCHFSQDVHGDGKLYGEVRAAIEIHCIDCHGDYDKKATLFTSGPAAKGPIDAGQPRGRNLAALKTPFGKPRFEKRGDQIVQHSMVTKDLSWTITQTVDTITPGNPKYSELSHLAKTVEHGPDGKLVWGGPPQKGHGCAHSSEKVNCIACHSAWNPSCFGCHLPQKANRKAPNLHNAGDVSRNLVSYDFQTLRDDIYMLAKDGNATGNRIGPARSSCAVHVGSYNANRESIYVQQQTISGEGLSGIAFSTNVPHTVRGRGVGETKLCSDCHLSKNNDNNAQMAQLLMHGTGFTNWMGKYCWIAAGHEGLFGVVVSETDEPQTVIGSTMHKVVYPEHYQKHLKHERHLKFAHEHPGKDIADNVLHAFRPVEVLDVQLRGEYLYAACGEAGVRVMDVAFIDHKGFSERITTAPVSPAGQKFYAKTKFATSVNAPITTAPDPTRIHFPENHEPDVHMFYAYIYITDREEGLVLVGAATTIDGNPTNNFLKRELAFNPNGLLDGAKSLAFVGTNAYICCDAGLVVVSLEDPKKPCVTAVLGKDVVCEPVAVAAQFRYAYVCDRDGLKVLDITDPQHPQCVNSMAMPGLHNIYLARTYAYLAAGHQGLAIVDITHPTEPRVEQVYNAGGKMGDVRDVQLGIYYNSQFAFIADGHNGLRVVQLTSPYTPGNNGFSPKPTPFLVATYPMHHGGDCVAVTRGVDRDRAVDESGNQTSVFGRVGARPLNLEEQHKLYLRHGQPWKVSNDPNDPEIYIRRGN